MRLIWNTVGNLLGSAATVAGLYGAAVAQTDPLLPHVPLEQDRVSPHNPPKNLPLQTEPAKADYFFYNHLKQDVPDTPIIYMKIPEQYVGKQSRPSHVFGLHLVIWYPEMTGSLNPANNERRKCLGWCNGEISMLIDNKIGLLMTNAEARLQLLFEKMEAEKNSTAPTIVFTKTDSINPGEESYTAKYVSGVDKGKTLLYLFRKSKEGKTTHFAECIPDDPSPGCEASMELSLHPGVSVQYNFSMSLMKEWTQVQDSVEKTVGSFFVTTFHP